MITINENNITVDFLKSDLVHIALEQEAHFSTQLMRELRAVSKINTGETVKNCIISNNKDFGKEAFHLVSVNKQKAKAMRSLGKYIGDVQEKKIQKGYFSPLTEEEQAKVMKGVEEGRLTPSMDEVKQTKQQRIPTWLHDFGHEESIEFMSNQKNNLKLEQQFREIILQNENKDRNTVPPFSFVVTSNWHLLELSEKLHNTVISEILQNPDAKSGRIVINFQYCAPGGGVNPALDESLVIWKINAQMAVVYPNCSDIVFLPQIFIIDSFSRFGGQLRAHQEVRPEVLKEIIHVVNQ